MKKLFFILFSVFLFSKEIFIASSANLTYVMPEIVKAFNHRHPDIKIKFVTSSSGKLTAQILRGAPYDIFLSADMKYPNFLYSRGIGVYKPKVYANGKIILFSLKKVSLKDISSIAISKPNLTPYGRAAVEFLKNSNLYSKLKDKIVYAPNIAAVLSYIKNGVDVGIISKSLIYAPNLKSMKFFYKEIDKSLYSPINQGALLIDKKAKIFYDFLFSKEAKNIFRKFGYQ